MFMIKIEDDRVIEITIGQIKLIPKSKISYSDIREHVRYFEENFQILPRGAEIRKKPVR